MNIPIDRITVDSELESLTPNGVVQTDSFNNLYSSKAITSAVLTTPTINGATVSGTINNSTPVLTGIINNSATNFFHGACTFSSNFSVDQIFPTSSSVDIASQYNPFRNAYAQQFIMPPNDANIGLILGHVNGPNVGYQVNDCINIGLGAQGNGMFIALDGSFQIMNSTSIKPSGISWSNPSDQRLKENVTDLQEGLSVVEQIRPRRFNYISDPEKTSVAGVIAQEIQQVYPNCIFEGRGDKMLHLDANDLLFILINAVRELSQKVKDIEATIK